MQLRWTWRIGRIAGIEVAIHPSWLFTYALFAWWMIVFVQTEQIRLDAAAEIALGLLASLVLFASVVAHEFAHAIVARRLGIPIGNIVLFLFGGVASILREPGTPLDEFKMAAAGPGLSLVLALLFGALYALLHRTPWLWGATFCLLLGVANLGLAVFNLLPMFPSDGGRLLRALLWRIVRSQARATGVAAIISTVIAAGLIFAGVYVAVAQRDPRSLWWVVIGAFLGQAALASARQARVGLALERLKVGDCMERRLIAVSSEASVSAFLGEVVPDLRRTGYPVVSGGRLVGLVSLRDTATIPPALWAGTPVSAVMTPASKASSLSSSMAASEALVELTKTQSHSLPVYEDDVLAGVVSEETIFGALRRRDGVPSA